jgi:DtxR family transcriptional regulator, Mn-dependent transcriptional regulator
MGESDLTVPAQDYLKLIWSASEWEGAAATVGGMAERLGVSPSTVSEGIRKLVDQGLVTHAKYGRIDLTPAGRLQAVRMVRRHRLLETFLVRVVGYTWDEVHNEAEVLEHAVSDKLIARIDALLGEPDSDPHGDPIPSAEGHTHRPDSTRLTNATAGGKFLVVRVSDEDPALLRYFSDLDLKPGSELTIAPRPVFAAGTAVRVGDGKEVALGTVASDAVWVVPASGT